MRRHKFADDSETVVGGELDGDEVVPAQVANCPSEFASSDLKSRYKLFHAKPDIPGTHNRGENIAFYSGLWEFRFAG